MTPLTKIDDSQREQEPNLFVEKECIHSFCQTLSPNKAKETGDSGFAMSTQRTQLEYWKKKLHGLAPSLDLPMDHPRQAVQSLADAEYTFFLNAGITSQLDNLARTQECTLYMVLLGIFNVLLYRYTMQNDICIGSLSAGRRYAGKRDMTGRLDNMLALRNYVDGDQTFVALLSQVKNTCLEALENKDMPFERVVEELQPQHNTAIHPIFQVMLVLQDPTLVTEQRLPDCAFEQTTSQLDLKVSFAEKNGALEGRVVYSTACYRQSAIARLADHIATLCRSVVGRPVERIYNLEYLSGTEWLQVVETFNDTSAAYAQNERIPDLFFRQVAISPDSIAVIDGRGSLTYRQLEAKSRALAMYLQSQGAEPDQIVGVCIERSCDMIVAILGVLISGAAYLPLDPAYPEERLAYMLTDCRARIVLTEQRLHATVSGFMPSETKLLELDSQWAQIAETASALRARGDKLVDVTSAGNLAYIIYTSGSTGQPKGVAIEHHSPVTLVYWASKIYSSEELSGVLGATSICFDLSIFEIFVTLANGGKLILLPNALALHGHQAKHLVTLINTAPSVMEQLLRMGTLPPSVQTVNLAGEALSPALVDKLYDMSGVTKVYDLYGPSEDTTYSTYTLRKKRGPATIGRPIANTQAYVLDSHLKPQAIGVPGELYLSGDGLARGYLNRPELTKEKFVANPFVAGARMYKTGDLVRWGEDCALQYLGRIDTQVKIHGLRIELGEIEARLNQHPVVDESAVIAKGPGGEKHLIAFYRARADERGGTLLTDDGSLRSFSLKTLPAYMVPSVFVKLDSIPLNQNGKVDRRALANIDVPFVSHQDYIAPRNEAEEKLAEMWERLLDRDTGTVGINDNFFELGGQSLLATQLTGAINTEFKVDLPLRAIFEQNTIAQMAQQIASTEQSAVTNLDRIDRSGISRLPLSFAQQGLWFLSVMQPDSAGYNLDLTLAIKGELKVQQLEQALNIIVERHEILRTVFPSDEGQTQQVVLPRLNIRLDRVDLSDRESGDAHSEVRAISERAAVETFDLAKGPLIRGILFRLSDEEHVLTLLMHHMVCDGWSLAILSKELRVILDGLRNGDEPSLPLLRSQYADYCLWERDRLNDGGMLEQQLGYWREKLSGLPERLDLIADYPRPTAQSVIGATQRFVIESDVVEKLNRLAQQKKCTLNMVLMTAFNVLLHRYSGESDICVGMPIANRRYPGSENLIGMFVNTLPVRNRVEADDTCSVLLARVKQSCLEAYEHQDTPFEKVVEMLRPQRDRAINPIFQVTCVLQNTVSGVSDERMSPYFLDSTISKFDLSLEFREAGGLLAGSLEYSTSLYRAETAARMCAHFSRLCRAICEAPRARICDLNYLSDAERARLLLMGSGEVVEYPREATVGDRFTEQALRCGASLALVFGEERLSYGELYARSVDLAMYLQSLGVGADSVVGLCLERSVELVVGIVGVTLAGGAYLPLDPSYPDDRLEYMLSDSGASVVLSQSVLGSRLGVLLEEEVAQVGLDGEWESVRERAAELRARGARLRREAGPETLSYVIYTSGSTGRPKGVEVEHRALVNRLHWMQKRYALAAGEVVLQKTPYSFDVSVWEFFWPLLEGATLVLAAPGGHKDVAYLEALIAREGVTTLHFVPPMLRAYLETARGQSGGVRRVFSSGEALDRRSVEQYRERFPNAELHNLYGPTEAAIDVTSFACAELEGDMAGEVVPIGRPIDNIQIHVLDPRGRLQPVGVAGELHIAGDGLARGYRNNPSLTAEKFVANPFRAGTRMYRTGDLARWMEDGNLQYLGRIDTQVKLRGFRIELGEIEACLNRHAGIEDSVVVLRERGQERHLVAFYRAKQTETGPAEAKQVAWLDGEQLRAHAARHLPEYMLPTAYVGLAEIPLTASGKADRRVLAAMEVKLKIKQTYVAPSTETERALIEIWSELLEIKPEDVGTRDSFFSVGGNSLSAVRLMAKINKRFGQSLPVANIFTAPTIEILAKLIRAPKASSTGILVPIQGQGDALPIFAIPGAGGNVLSLQPLSVTFGPNQPFYGLEAVGLDGKSSPLSTVEETAKVNIESLKAVQPLGPYSLLGHSYGGVVAYEMARILLEQSEQVASLILLDSVAPSVIQEQVAIQETNMLFEACATAAGFYDMPLPFDREQLGTLSDAKAISDTVCLLNRHGAEITVEQFTAFFRVSQANLLSYQMYRPLSMPVSINASLYRAMKGRSSLLPPDLGWSELLTDPIRVIDVEADHFSILRTNIFDR